MTRGYIILNTTATLTHDTLTVVHPAVGSSPHVGVFYYRHSLDAKCKACAYFFHSLKVEV